MAHNIGSEYSAPSVDSAKENVKEYPVTGWITQKHIIVTQDHAALVFKRFREAMQLTDWFSWLGVTLTLVIARVTAKFEDVWIFPSEQIKGFFSMMIVVAFILTIICSVRRRKGRKQFVCQEFLRQLQDTDIGE